jgi:hypothetical protein
MKENLMMIIPQLMKMTNRAGAMLEYNIATSHRYRTVIPMNVPRIA